jgi:SlyX protein
MADTEALIARLDALEIRLVHQERMLEDLNSTITTQWKEIERLTRMLARLEDQMQEIRDSGASGGAEPPPPHY